MRVIDDLLGPAPNFDRGRWRRNHADLVDDPDCRVWLRLVRTLPADDARHKAAVLMLNKVCSHAHRMAARSQWISRNPREHAADTRRRDRAKVRGARRMGR